MMAPSSIIIFCQMKRHTDLSLWVKIKGQGDEVKGHFNGMALGSLICSCSALYLPAHCTDLIMYILAVILPISFDFIEVEF